MPCCHSRRLWWLILAILAAIGQVSASRRRPLLFPFVQALKQNNNKKDATKTNNKESWTDGYVSEPYTPETLDDDDDDEQEDSDNILPHVHSLLQVPCAIHVPDNKHHQTTAITTIVDTGAQVTVLSSEAAQKCGVAHLMDQRYAGHAAGVGSCRVLGRIPAGALALHLGETSVKSPAITVLDNNSMGMDLLLGMDFLRDTGAILNMREEVMILQHAKEQEQVVIPFLRPKTDVDVAGGWINKDIIKSLQNNGGVDLCGECSDDDDDEDGDDEFNDLDMSGV